MVDTDENLMVHNIRIELTQDNDTCQDSDVAQELTLELEDSGAGHFMRLTTGSKGWSLDDIEDIKKQLRNVQSKVNDIFDTLIEDK